MFFYVEDGDSGVEGILGVEGVLGVEEVLGTEGIASIGELDIFEIGGEVEFEALGSGAEGQTSTFFPPTKC